jgi:hypothetical protein
LIRAALVALGLAVSSVAAIATPEPAARPSPLLAFQAKEQRLFSIGWRLVTANAPYCDATVPGVGMLLHDATSYRDPPAVRAALGLRGDVAVQAVAPDSPAHKAGMRPNASIHSVNEVLVEEHFAPTDPNWKRLVAINEAIEAEFALFGPAIIAWSSADGMTHAEHIVAVPACATRFELTGGKRAVADGARVVIGERFEGFAYDDTLLAAAVAHELAHNLLGHRAWLDAKGRGLSNIRRTEREADRLAPWLLANAGYPPEAAARFMRRWGPGNDGGLLRRPTHQGWDERAEAIEAELPLVEQAILREGQADWRTLFEKEPGA